MRRIVWLAAAVLATAVGISALTYVGASRRGSLPRAGQLPASTGLGVDAPLGGVALGAGIEPPSRTQVGELDRLIRAYDLQVESAPNATALSFIGRLELERARLTGDVASYARATSALERARALSPSDPDIGMLLATARYTTHDFSGALALARTIQAETGALGAIAVVGDASLELGDYDAAARAYGILGAEIPTSAAVRARLARLAFVRGDADEAVRLARSAERAALADGTFGPRLAFYTMLRAKLALDLGSYDVAAALYGRAVTTAPGYHVALAGLGSARAAQGLIDDAIRLYRRAVAIVPEPLTLSALGDLYSLQGRGRPAQRRYDTVEAIATLARINRRLYDRQLAVFWADHDLEAVEAVRIAETSLVTRQDVYGHDALAWSLYRAGRLDEARAASDRALVFGTPDPRLWFHAGMISAALGDEARAAEELGSALRLSPRFDPLLAPLARATLAGLSGAGA